MQYMSKRPIKLGTTKANREENTLTVIMQVWNLWYTIKGE